MKASLFLAIFFYAFFAHAFGGWFKPKSDFKGANSRSQTEGRVEHATAGTCLDCNLKADGLSQLGLPNDLGKSMQGVLTNLYGFCEAQKPLNHIATHGHSQEKRNLRYALATSDDTSIGPGEVRISGISDARIRAGFDNVRKVNPNRPVLGPYQSVDGALNYCRKSVSVGGDRLNPSQVYKMFGNGASGRMVNGKFNLFSCGSQAYLKQQTDVQKAFRCGLHPESAPAISIDCAEMIGAASVGACIKLHPNQKIDSGGIKLGDRELSTHSLSPDKNECLKTPNVSVDMPVMSGDMFVFDTHSIMITQVGNDPFGIRAARGNCSSINADDFNFSFAQSTSHREIGPIQSTARAASQLGMRDGLRTSSGYSNPNMFPLNHLVAMARVMCERHKRGQASGPSSNFMNGPTSYLRQMRHNSTNPACKYPEGKCPQTEGDECAEYCGV